MRALDGGRLRRRLAIAAVGGLTVAGALFQPGHLDAQAASPSGQAWAWGMNRPGNLGDSRSLTGGSHGRAKRIKECEGPEAVSP